MRLSTNPCNTPERIAFIKRAWTEDDMFIEDIVAHLNTMTPNPDAKEQVSASHVRFVTEKLRLKRSQTFMEKLRSMTKRPSLEMEINEVDVRPLETYTRDGSASVASAMIAQEIQKTYAAARADPETVVEWWTRNCLKSSELTADQIKHVRKREDAWAIIGEVNKMRAIYGLPKYEIAC